MKLQQVKMEQGVDGERGRERKRERGQQINGVRDRAWTEMEMAWVGNGC
jgi:hypothetical protein